jgi:hypothetical protein
VLSQQAAAADRQQMYVQNNALQHTAASNSQLLQQASLCLGVLRQQVAAADRQHEAKSAKHKPQVHHPAHSSIFSHGGWGPI